MIQSRNTTFSILTLLLLFLEQTIQILGTTDVKNKSTVSRISYYEQLRNDILSRPVAVHKIPPAFLDEENSSYNVSFQLWLADISNIDELNQVITVNAYIDIRWTQKELSWNSSDYDGINLILMNVETLWTPLVLVVMGQKDSNVLEFAQTVQVTSDGEVKSTRHNYLTFTCNIEFVRYPFDVQVCSVAFLPTGTTTRPEIKITYMSEYPLSTYVSVNGEWSLDNTSSEVVQTSTMFEMARYNFTMRRQCEYYVITCIFPLVLTSLMIPLTFLVPSETGEKISYLVAMFTSTAIFLNYISDVMPRSLSLMPYLAVLLIEVLVEGLLAVLASVLVVSTHLQEKRFPEDKHNHSDHADRKTVTNKCCKETYKDPTEKPEAASIVVKPILWRELCLKMTSGQLDRIFFYIFTLGQATFLLVMFGVTDWL